MHFKWYPGVDFAVLVNDSFWPHQTARVENAVRPLWIDLEHRAHLDVDIVLARLLLHPLGMLVGNLDAEIVDQFRGCRKNRSGMSKLGENNQANRQEWRRPGYR